MPDEMSISTLPVTNLNGLLDGAREPLAIVGIGCHFPGGANDPGAFWQLLRAGVDAISEVPADRWLSKVYYDPDPKKLGKLCTRRSGFLTQIDRFDPLFFGISPREAAAMDPQHRLLLELAWEALEDAGAPAERLAGSRTGVFVGLSTQDYGNTQAQPTERKPRNPYVALGTAFSIAANRISYTFDFRGPSLAVDTACSSSLVALHLACRSLWQGEAELALVGGANVILRPETSIFFSNSGMLSPDGRCKSFDARADGYVRGEGGGVVLLKPLAQALRDNDRVYALILGSAVNQDGRTPSITLPSVTAQAAMLRAAYLDANIRPADVQYIEAHGTGTEAGDPVEANALGMVLSEGRADDDGCWIGSVKTNIGHLEAGAGVAGLIKAALALYHGEIPPSLHFESPNPEIDFDKLRLRVPRALEPWPGNGSRPRLAGVNSFGFGGANAHAVLAGVEAVASGRQGCNNGEAVGVSRNANAQVSLSPCLVPLSARSASALHALAGSYVGWLAANPDVSLAEFCYNVGVRRSHHAHRLAVVATNPSQLQEKLEAFHKGDTMPDVSLGRAGTAPKLVFVFTGMGPQWWAMGRQLLAQEAAFRHTVEEIDRLLRALAGWSLLEELTAEREQSRLDEPWLAQPALFAVQVGLAELWRTWGARPDVVVGHSVGEVAAAYAAGVLSLPDAVQVIFQRSRLQHRASGQGKMLAVALSAAEAEHTFAAHQDRVALAAVNSPTAVTLSGDGGALAEIARNLEADGIFCRFLQVDVPYHSPLMEPLREELLRSLANLQPRAGAVPLWSTVTGACIEGATLDADYWWRNVRQPVAFAAAVTDLIETDHDVFLEIGPHPVLAPALSECAAEARRLVTVLPSLRRPRAGEDGETPAHVAGAAERAQLLNSLGRLYTLGIPVAWERLVPAGRLLRLPTYPWQREHCWRESEESRQIRVGESAAAFPGLMGKLEHRLLGQQLRTAHGARVWHSELDLEVDHSWLLDHRIQGTTVYPAAAYVEIAVAAGDQIPGTNLRVLEDVEFHRPLLFAADETRAIELIVEGDLSFAACARDADGSWTRHATGRLARDRTPAPAPLALDVIQARCNRGEIVTAEWYPQLKEFGFDFGVCFQGVERVWCGHSEALGLIRVPAPLASGLADCLLHPAILDCCIQISRGALPFRAGNRLDPGMYIPKRLERVRLFRRLGDVSRPAPVTGATPDADRQIHFYCHLRMNQQPAGPSRADFWLADEAGQVLAECIGLYSIDISANNRSILANLDECLFEYRWQLQPHNRQLTGDLPNLADLAATLRPEIRRLREELGLATGGSRIGTQLNQLAAAFIHQALRELGWSGTPETAEALAGRLGVVPRYHNVFAWLLTVAERESAVGAAVTLWREAIRRQPEYVAELTLLGRCGTNLVGILRGTIEPAELFFPGGSPTALEHLLQDAPSRLFLNAAVQATVAALVRHTPPERPLRILELYAGTGGLTSHVLPVLPAQRTRYIVTDISERLSALAAQKFRSFPFVQCQTFDPHNQQLESHAFDLILCGDGLGRSLNLGTVLGHCNRLLAPDGLLLLTEQLQDNYLLTLLYALLPDWCGHVGAPAGRPPMREAFTESFVLAENDAATLILARGPCGPVDAGTKPQMIERAAAVSVSLSAPALVAAVAAPEGGSWLIFADQGDVARALAMHLTRCGESVVQVRHGETYRRVSCHEYEVCPQRPEDFRRLLDDMLAQAGAWRGIVHLWSLDGPALDADPATLEQANTLGCLSALHLVQACAQAAWEELPRLWLVTRGVQPIGGATPAVGQAPLWGLGRVVMSEHPELRCTLIDLGSQPAADEIQSLFTELRSDDLEDEIALRRERRYVHRLLPAETRASGAMPLPYRLEVGTPGLVDSLSLRSFAPQPPGPDEVVIEVHAAGMNFKDVAKVIGLLGDASLQGTMSGSQLGLECAGKIIACGAGVTDLQVGDEVIAQAPGCFASQVTVPTMQVARKPANLTFAETVTMPVAFGTAAYALHELGRLRAGEKILIHAASGGVGLAAIQIAQRAGAEVFATAGSAEKRDFLRLLGVRHVMDSRTLDFVDEIRDRTGGHGVDVVLNSLAGEALAASLSVLAPGGRFLELGKRDIEQNARLGLRPFQNNLSFFAIDLDRLWAARPDNTRDALADLMRRTAAGEITPLPFRAFPVSQAREAFRWMARAKHIGKVVLSFRDPAARPTPPAAETIQFRADATYLVTGGLGGFGLATARWLVERGARHLALLGRSGAASPAAQQAVRELEQAGARVLVARADVAQSAELEQVLVELRRTMPPLRGVFHAAMVLDDGTLLNLDADRLHEVMAPKAAGAWNLHRLTVTDALDYFVLYSSIAAVFGNRGQGNYAAANLFLDTLAQHRRALGLPALSVNWTAVADVGYVARHADVRTHLEKLGFAAIPARQLLQALGTLLQLGNVQTAVMRAEGLHGSLHLLAALSPRFGALGTTTAARADAGTGSSTSAFLRDLLRTAKGAERQELLKTCLREQIGKSLGVSPTSIDPDQPLTSLGLESLMAIELGTRLKKELGVEIPVMKLLRGVTVNNLLHDLLQALGGEEAASANGVAPAAFPARPRPPHRRFDPPTAVRLTPTLGRDAGGAGASDTAHDG